MKKIWLCVFSGLKKISTNPAAFWKTVLAIFIIFSRSKYLFYWAPGENLNFSEFLRFLRNFWSQKKHRHIEKITKYREIYEKKVRKKRNVPSFNEFSGKFLKPISKKKFLKFSNFFWKIFSSRFFFLRKLFY